MHATSPHTIAHVLLASMSNTGEERMAAVSSLSNDQSVKLLYEVVFVTFLDQLYKHLCMTSQCPLCCNCLIITNLNTSAPVKSKWLYTVDFNYTSLYPFDNIAGND